MSVLDPLMLAPARLRLCALLSAADWVEFAKARDTLEVSDSVLSKHVSTLSEADYVQVRKGVLEGRRTTWVGFTSAGRSGFRGHVAALQAVIDSAEVDAPARAQPRPRTADARTGRASEAR